MSYDMYHFLFLLYDKGHLLPTSTKTKKYCHFVFVFVVHKGWPFNNQQISGKHYRYDLEHTVLVPVVSKGYVLQSAKYSVKLILPVGWY